MLKIPCNLLKEHRSIIDKAIMFFTSKYTNPGEFEKIKVICIDATSKSNIHFLEVQYVQNIQQGFLSINDFTAYLHKKENITSLPYAFYTIVEFTLKRLTDYHIVQELPETVSSRLHARRYAATERRAKAFYDDGIIINIIGGWEFIIDRYAKSVYKIENLAASGSISIGTGFHYKRIDKNVKHINHSYIVTNEHVVAGSNKLVIRDKDDRIIKYKTIYIDPNKDLAFILLDQAETSEPFYIDMSVTILEEIITIGYPAIPTTREAYQVIHKGEVNSFVKDYFEGNEYFLFSAKTSSGNSGSPIVNEYGKVTGLVCRELFEKNDFLEKGKPPYYPAIPGIVIFHSLYDSIRERRIFKYK